MKIQSSNLNYINFNHLTADDILRMPLKQKTFVDFYQTRQHDKKPQKSKVWQNIFTAATFALTGLYIAHRNNLFNPVRREAKKIINNKNLFNRVREFIDSSVNDATYKKATKNLLVKISNNKKVSKSVISETNNILNDSEKFNKLCSQVIKKLNDDKITGLKDGYTIDVLDSLFHKIEKNLKTHKEQGLPYKNQSANIIDSLFAPNTDGSSIVDTTLQEIINNRSSVVVDNFIQDLIIKSNTIV